MADFRHNITSRASRGRCVAPPKSIGGPRRDQIFNSRARRSCGILKSADRSILTVRRAGSPAPRVPRLEALRRSCAPKAEIHHAARLAFSVRRDVMSTSMLMFGLGAVALLRASHQEFASIPSRRRPLKPCSRRSEAGPVAGDAARRTTVAEDGSHWPSKRNMLAGSTGCRFNAGGIRKPAGRARRDRCARRPRRRHRKSARRPRRRR